MAWIQTGRPYVGYGCFRLPAQARQGRQPNQYQQYAKWVKGVKPKRFMEKARKDPAIAAIYKAGQRQSGEAAHQGGVNGERRRSRPANAAASAESEAIMDTFKLLLRDSRFWAAVILLNQRDPLLLRAHLPGDDLGRLQRRRRDHHRRAGDQRLAGAGPRGAGAEAGVTHATYHALSCSTTSTRTARRSRCKSRRTACPCASWIVRTPSRRASRARSARLGDNIVLATPGSGWQYIIPKLQIHNESTTATTVIVKFGSREVWRVYLPASAGAERDAGLPGAGSPGRPRQPAPDSEPGRG